MTKHRNGGYSYAPSDQSRPKPAPAPARPPSKETTFEPCGFRAKTTGTLIANLDSAYEYGVRQPNGRRLTEEQWAEHCQENFEIVYRAIVESESSSE